MLKERLRRCVERVGNGANLARTTGIPRRTLETYLSGAAEPKASRLAAIARSAGVSGHWLLTGEGPECGDENDSVAQFVAIEKPAVGGSNEQARGSVAPVGPPSRLAFHRDWMNQHGWKADRLRLVRTLGDCMAPTVRDGALMLVDSSLDTMREEGVYVLEVDDALLVRRVQFDVNGGLIATSDNPAYQRQRLDPDDRNGLSVFGKVVWVGNPME